MESLDPNPSPDGSISLGEYVGVLRRQWVLVVLLTALGGAAGYVAAARQPLSYVATAAVVIQPIEANPFDATTAPSQLVSATNETNIVGSTVVAARASKLLHANVTPTHLLSHLSVSVPTNSQVLDISYTAATAASAAAGANAFAAAYLSYRGDTAVSKADAIGGNIGRQLASVTQQISAVNGKIASTSPNSALYQDALINRQVLTEQLSALHSQQTSLASLAINPGTIITQAVPPTAGAGARKVLFWGGGGMLGLLVGLVLAFVRDRLDTRVRLERPARDQVGAALLGALPTPPSRGRRARLMVRAVARGPWEEGAEPYRVLAAKTLAVAGTGNRSILVVALDSPMPGGEMARGLAGAIAANGYPVRLLADTTRMESADRPTSPGAATRYDLVRMAPALSGAPELTTADDATTSQELLTVTASHLPEVLNDRPNTGEVTIIETTARDRVSDTLTFARFVDVVLVVARDGRTRRHAVAHVISEVRSVGSAKVYLIGFTSRMSTAFPGRRRRKLRDVRRHPVATPSPPVAAIRPVPEPAAVDHDASSIVSVSAPQTLPHRSVWRGLHRKAKRGGDAPTLSSSNGSRSTKEEGELPSPNHDRDVERVIRRGEP